MVKKLLLAIIMLLVSVSIGLAQKVIDGDTLQIDDKRIRIFGIDTPEKNQLCSTKNQKWACGLVATSELIKLVSGKEIKCEKITVDRYKRIVARCFADGKDIGKAMVSSGWALAYRQYSMDYVQDEEVAQSKKLGLWSNQFLKPSEWREKSKSKQNNTLSKSNNSECIIKGNISSNGTKIYHQPGGVYYSRTKIDTSKGERWFCSKFEAEEAGWRASKR